MAELNNQEADIQAELNDLKVSLMENKESLLNYLTALLDRDEVNCLKISSYISDLTAAKSEANNLIIKLTTLLTSKAFLSPAVSSPLANIKVRLTKIKNYHINYSKQ